MSRPAPGRTGSKRAAERSRLVRVALFLTLLASPAGIRPAEAQTYTYTNAPLKDVIADIQNRGDFRFLYRDALIVDKRITLRADAEHLVAALESALSRYEVGLRYDPIHRQILLFETTAAAPARPSLLSGQVIDAQSGGRLPYASITWLQDGRVRGVTTNEAGVFTIRVDQGFAAMPVVDLRISYIGYEPATLRLVADAYPEEISVRLRPEPIRGQEVLVSSSILETDLDTTWLYLISDQFSPLSESSVLRGLQPLPMVAVSPAMTEGINVRGSKADGFQVLLDGASIYNQNHFFGFFDVFNTDALQTVGFYYDIAPASYFAPPGGTMSFITRSGSLNRMRGSLGASSTAVRGTLEGPIGAGSSSWLVSGRHSYIDTVDWLNNNDLVLIGLDVNRSKSALPEAYAGVENRLVTPGPAAARFYDVHAKLYNEGANGRRRMATLYFGGNNTLLKADRIFSERDPETNVLQTQTRPVETRNTWGNEAVSIQFHRPVGRRAYLQSRAAGSHYRSVFSKDDFVFTRINGQTGQPRNFIFPFNYENELFDVQWAENLTITPRYPGRWSLGTAANYYALFYHENSASRPEFREDYFAMQADAFAQYETTDFEFFDASIGLRSHYFTQGHAFKLSPRAQVTLLPGKAVSFKLGFSKNYQFLHHLYLQNTNSASVWIMTTGASKPSEVNNLTAGMYIKPGRSAAFQVEAYTRDHANLRRHEINAPAGVTTANDNRFVPWFSDNRAFARGIETMYRQRIGPVSWTNSYTLSRVEIQNGRVNRGERFPAEWDRRHQFSTHLAIPVVASTTVFATWYYATGTPNILAYDDAAERAYLPDYHRLDAGIRFSTPVRTARIEAGISVYNAYNRKNIWYRDPIQVYSQERPAQGFSFVNVDVYDLGLQPAFDLSISW
ncbi:MAG: TonB-dependent receptor [Rhodothermales bacterium]